MLMDRLVPCLQPGCGRAARLRGLCHSHYQKLQKRVQAGQLSWEQAIEQGLCAARTAPGCAWMSGFYAGKGRRRWGGGRRHGR